MICASTYVAWARRRCALAAAVVREREKLARLTEVGRALQALTSTKGVDDGR